MNNNENYKENEILKETAKFLKRYQNEWSQIDYNFYLDINQLYNCRGFEEVLKYNNSTSMNQLEAHAVSIREQFDKILSSLPNSID